MRYQCRLGVRLDSNLKFHEFKANQGGGKTAEIHCQQGPCHLQEATVGPTLLYESDLVSNAYPKIACLPHLRLCWLPYADTCHRKSDLTTDRPCTLVPLSERLKSVSDIRCPPSRSPDYLPRSLILPPRGKKEDRDIAAVVRRVQLEMGWRQCCLRAQHNPAPKYQTRGEK